MCTEQARDLSEIKRFQTNEEGRKTATTTDQIKTESSVERLYSRYEQLAAMDPSLPTLTRMDHARYLEISLERLSSGYECLDCSRPWLVYWILNAASVLGVKFTDSLLNRVVDFLIKCRSQNGGFAGGPGQDPHLAPTYAAVNALCIIGTDKALNAINRRTLKEFLWTVREPNGAFRMHVGGELDVRGAYCAISSAKLATFSAEDESRLFEGTANWIAECQTYEGGFGGTPDLEAHGGYSFCAAAALVILGGEEKCDLNALLRWAVNRQMAYEGGFQGRTNKLVDGCYSFWQGALIPIVQSLMARKEGRPEIMDTVLFHRMALQEYVLICCQKPSGGLIDKPGKPADLYHTCYTLSGLAVAQHCETNKPPVVLGHPDNEILPTHPVHNIPPKAVIDAYKYFLNNELLEPDRVNGHCNGGGGDDIEMKDCPMDDTSESSRKRAETPAGDTDSMSGISAGADLQEEQSVETASESSSACSSERSSAERSQS
ncbi:protein farnesyltransferase subunit beta [Malaya genurostris]|uniref:protein farnesyltransferase subunit beta n=1 Tax=Malaya genurostris TaxID=325434 RepID=UPI0026F3E219|nr:protein farnesyltransferase subunit beta [Malaya genurostris]